MSCHGTASVLEPFMDGELGPEKILEVEQHIEQCKLCRERLRLGQALRTSLRQVVRPSLEASQAFRSRLSATIEAVREREWNEGLRERQLESRRMLPWRTILPVAAAATLTLVWAAKLNPDQEMAHSAKTKSQYAKIEPLNLDDVLEELVEHHVRGTPDVTEPALLPSFEQQVGVPVRIPSLIQYGARWEGGSVVPVRNQRAASLRYKLDGHRVTLYLFDSARFPVGKGLQRRLVGDEAVYVGNRRGYSIGATDHRGIGYAVASDLNDAETAEIVAALY